MREIKFRAWDKEAELMAYWEEIDQLDADGLLPFLDMLKNDRHMIMQYTGLKDKNGKEIYEGDIIKTSLGHVAAVEWYDENGRFLAFTATRRIMYVGREPAVEVIGNIYENPDLLKEDKPCTT